MWTGSAPYDCGLKQTHNRNLKTVVLKQVCEFGCFLSAPTMYAHESHPNVFAKDNKPVAAQSGR